jgi:hypothetical protein
MDKNKLTRTVSDMVYDDRIAILSFLHTKGVKITEGADGCYVNLDRLDEETYELLVEFVIHIQKNKPCIHQM